MFDVTQLPDSSLCQAAINYARTVSPPFLFNHVMRSALFAQEIGRIKGMRFDREVLCTASVLHDLGLTHVAPVKQRFELEGADAAKAFLSERGMADSAVDLVWDAIALHTTVEIPLRKQAEVALCFLGIAADLAMLPPGSLAATTVEAAHGLFPWGSTEEELLKALVGLYHRNPAAAASNAVADVCERRVPGFKRFNLCDHLLAQFPPR